MLRIKALGPCTLAGFRTLLRGEVCDVPDERQEHVERLRIAGCVELLEIPPAPVAAEPSGNNAPTDAGSSTTPAALTDADELARLEAELASLEKPADAAPAAPKRALILCAFCGKAFQDHAKGKPPKDAADCAGLKALFKPAKAALAAT